MGLGRSNIAVCVQVGPHSAFPADKHGQLVFSHSMKSVFTLNEIGVHIKSRSCFYFRKAGKL